MTLDAEVGAVRASVALSDMDHVARVRVSGPGAFAAVDRIVPRELFIRDGQALHTVLLDDHGRPRADLYVVNDDDDYLLLAEGVDGPTLAAAAGGAAAGAVDLGPTWRILSVNGPYAWELLAEALTPDIIGLPYLGCFHLEDLICLRAGKTGEYGYDLLVPAGRASALRRALVEAGRRFDLVEAGLPALDTCALENGFFSIRWPLLDDVTPIELQLQWRVSYRKSGYPGAEALLARRRDRARRRRTLTLLSPGPIAARDALTCDGDTVGTVLAAARSPLRQGWVALALVDRAYAVAGLDAFTVRGGAVHSVSAPVLDNRSLFVDPQRHSYLTRHEDTFPPVAPRPPWDAS